MSAADIIVRLKIVLDDAEPPIWRAVELPARTGLKELHHIIQAAMGWDDEHLYSFQIGRQKIDGRDQLGELIASGVKRFGYLYDMGDSWQHTLRVERTYAADPKQSYPRFVDGAGRCPPEDCGGIPGFYNLLDALADPKHPDHENLTEWVGGEFEPEAFDLGETNESLRRIR
jgi:hypothetical protein